MLVASALNEVGAKVYYGTAPEVKAELFFQNLHQMDISAYQDERVMVKGCSDIPEPDKAYVVLTKRLVPVVKSLMFGEPCSAVPVYKKRKA